MYKIYENSSKLRQRICNVLQNRIELYNSGIVTGNADCLMDMLKDNLIPTHFSYYYDGCLYNTFEQLADRLLAAGNYQALKRFNACQYWIAQKRGFKFPRNYYPMDVQVEHTSYCNARCIMCHHYYAGNQFSSHISDEAFNKIRPLLPYAERVGLHGYGEPFLHPKILEYMAEYHKYGIKLYTNTNLSVLPKGIEPYFERDFDFFNISCDGASRETFNGIRAGLSFEQFCKNAAWLREHCGSARLNIAVVSMRQNLRESEDLVRLAKQLGFDSITFSKVGINPVIGNYEDAVRNYRETANYYYSRAQETAASLEIEIHLPQSLTDTSDEKLRQEIIEMDRLPFADFDMSAIMERFHRIPSKGMSIARPIEEQDMEGTVPCNGVCDWLEKMVYISVEGKICACCSNSNYYLGDLHKNTAQEIWNNQNYYQLIRKFQSGKLPQMCMYCNLLAKRMLKDVYCDPMSLSL